jgi:1,4-dihydroxy-2-naphthoyl-CoA synthase
MHSQKGEERLMEFENIIYSKKDGIATIRLNRPKVVNLLPRWRIAAKMPTSVQSS